PATPAKRRGRGDQRQRQRPACPETEPLSVVTARRASALAMLILAVSAPGQEPDDDEDGQRDQHDDDKRLERGEDPARCRDGKPDGEDLTKDCPDDPAHVPSMHPASPAALGRVRGGSGPWRRA